MSTVGRAPALAAAGAVLLAAACATVHVSTDYDPTVDFSVYHSFQLAGGHLLNEGVPDDNNTLVKDRIEAALRTTLQAKGLREVGKAAAGQETAGADLDVGYFAGARTRTEIEAMPGYGPGFGPFWYGGWWDPAYNTWWTATYNEGTLVIDLVDARTKRLVWRAYARAEIHVPVTQEKIQNAVSEAFRSFPPRK